uniref:5-formyltetrahydrofolate cyclo-ligase n=1 Tax=Globodera rostochiensis TaxID=31243 RepID=A0A914H3N8_GLORO
MSNTPHLAKKILRKEIRGLIAQQMAAEGNWENIREKESASVVKKLFNNEWKFAPMTSSEKPSGRAKKCSSPDSKKEPNEWKCSGWNRKRSSIRWKAHFGGQCHRIRQHPAHFSPPTLDETPAKKPLDLVVMPGLAFTTSGKRLGHGRGFYDRFLNDYAQKYGTAPKTIGLALKVQLVDDLPMESKDRMVDLLIHA